MGNRLIFLYLVLLRRGLKEDAKYEKDISTFQSKKEENARVLGPYAYH